MLPVSCVSLGIACANGQYQGNPRTPVAAVKPLEPITPARLFAVPRTDLGPIEPGPEGQHRQIVHGMRVEAGSDGVLRRSSQLLPATTAAQALTLPPRLGSGYLFYVVGSDQTSIWKASDFTGELSPLVSLPLEADSVVAGFDRIYVMPKGGDRPVAVNAQTGKVMQLGPLPPAPSYTHLAFLNGWEGAAEVPFLGVLVSDDAGLSWSPLGPGIGGLSLKNGRITVSARGTRFQVRSGQLSELDDAANDLLFMSVGSEPYTYGFWDLPEELSNEPPSAQAFVFPELPLRRAVLSGVLESPRLAVLAQDGVLARVDLNSGKLLKVVTGAFAESGPCTGLRVGDAEGFLCGQEQGRTSVYVLEQDLSLRKVLGFDEPRMVIGGQNGLLLIRGGCGSKKKEQTRFCVWDPKQPSWEVLVPAEDERVVALEDGRVAVVEPPRTKQKASLSFLDAKRRAKKVALRLPTLERGAQAVWEHGTWLNGFVQTRLKGNKWAICGWIAGAEVVLGVRLYEDGQVEVSQPRDSAGAVLISQGRAIVLDGLGGAMESVDFGFSWSDVPLPKRSAADDNGLGVDRAVEQGCSTVGCAFGDWLRIGYGTSDKPDDQLRVSEVPALTRLLAPGGAAWRMSCQLVKRRAPAPRRPTSRPSEFTLRRSDWSAFAGVPAPVLRHDERGFGAGGHTGRVLFKAYVWGARGGPWDRTGWFQVRVFDRFSMQEPIWSTSPARSSWPTEHDAARALGVDHAGGAGLNVVLDAGGRGGVLQIGSTAGNELYLLEPERPAVKLDPPDGSSSLNVISYAKLDNAVFLLSRSRSEGFAVYRTEGLRLIQIADFDAPPGDSIQAVGLIRDLRGQGLALWVRATDWYIMPIDPATGLLASPTVIEASALANMPEACGAEAEGWLVLDTLRIAPYVEVADQRAEFAQMEARLVVSEQAVCLEDLAAEGRIATDARRQGGRATGRGVGSSLMLTPRNRVSGAWELACSP